MIPWISNKDARDLYIYAAAAVDFWPAHFSIEHEKGGIIFIPQTGFGKLILWMAEYWRSRWTKFL